MDLKKVFVIGTGAFVLVCLFLFYVLLNSTKMMAQSQRELNLERMEQKLQSLEAAFQSHKMSMKELEALAVLAKKDKNNKDEEKHVMSNEVIEDKVQAKCSSAVGMEGIPRADIHMLDVYELLKFDNPNGGGWKQGWDVKIDSSRFTSSNKLKVFVIPHSHNDPGWIKTFEKYYQDQTRNILDNMLQALSSDPTLKFVWAEISYFNLWWNELTDIEKKQVQKIVENKQLEFVTGGWVMPDEANSHFYSILLQLTEGHQWLFHHLNYIPKNGWSIDPFGMSPTMAYVLKRAGLSNMLIQRTHYSVKKHLAKLTELEFKWRQLWDSSGSTDILCHMMPFYSYDIPHTCGPEPKVCCQFDFKRMRDVSAVTCPWNVPPKPIVTHNVHERSLTLLDQYKKKAMLYKSNVLLVPLGDDFRWEDKPEWDAQVTNYQKLFDYINSHSELYTEVKFGTLDDYFQALGTELARGEFKLNALTGDFFTYADRDDHYWSGYYTSRPFHKAMDRELIGHLRAAQILFTIMSAEASRKYGDIGGSDFIRNLLGKIIFARRNLSLFQHHDGVTGTSKDHVMVDYAEKLYEGIKACNYVMEKSLHVLTHLKDPKLDLEAEEDPIAFYDPVVSKDHHHSLPHHNIIIVDHDLTDRLITVFNPSIHSRTEIVTVYVSTYLVKIVDIEGEAQEFEILPVFKDKTEVSSNTFQLVFFTELKPFAVKSFILKHDPSSQFEAPEVTLFNAPTTVFHSDKFKLKQGTRNEQIFISNGYLTVYFKEDGFARSVVVDGKEHKFDVGMYKYGVMNRPETSGLYLFIPDGEATPLPAIKPFIRVVNGKFMSYAEVFLRQVKHRITVYNRPGFERSFIDITNVMDIREENNFELMMRFITEIESKGIAYTDLNGFQMIRRKKFDKLPLQANYYPLPSATYIEDSTLRMTVLSRQPLGTASLSSGEIEVMMDRRLMQDDNRGVGQGGKDNLETVNAFRIMFEVPQCEDPKSSKKAPMLSLAAHLALNDLLHPFRTFFSPMELTPSTISAVSDYSPSPLLNEDKRVPCDVDLVDLTMLPHYSQPLDDRSFVPSTEAALTVHRFGFDGRFLNGIALPDCSIKENELGRFAFDDILGDLFQPKIKQATLSFVHEGKTLSAKESILMKPMEVYGFKLFLKGRI